MTTPGAGLLRGVRVLLLAAAVVVLSGVSHDLAGGAAPGTVPLVVLTVLVALAVLPLARRQVGLSRLLALLGAGQVVLHHVFERCAALVPTPVPTPHAHEDTSSTLTMLGAHAVATLGVALVLRYGDAVLWRLWAWLGGRRIPRRLRSVAVRPQALAAGPLAVGHPAVVPCTTRGRAPPVLACS